MNGNIYLVSGLPLPNCWSSSVFENAILHIFLIIMISIRCSGMFQNVPDVPCSWFYWRPFMNGQSKTQANSIIVPVWLSYASPTDWATSVRSLRQSIRHNMRCRYRPQSSWCFRAWGKFVVIDNACHWDEKESSNKPLYGYLKPFHVKLFQRKDLTFQDLSQHFNGVIWRRLQHRLHPITTMWT